MSAASLVRASFISKSFFQAMV